MHTIEHLVQKGRKNMKSNDYWSICQVVLEDGIAYVTEDAKKYTGMEVELRLPIKEKHAVVFLNAVITYCRIKKEPIKPDTIIQDIFGVPVIFKVVESILGTEKHAMRLIFPDSKGFLPDNEKCDHVFKRQIL